MSKPPLAATPLDGRSARDRLADRAHETWRQELATAIRDPAELCGLLDLDPAEAESWRQAAGDFPMLVPRGFVARMRPRDPRDPLLLQVLPLPAERESHPGYSADPLAEREALAAPALVRKYAGRVLLLVTGGCAVHCRYCFRREFPYAEIGVGRPGLAAALDTVAADVSIQEVILSGGDPLLVDDEHLAGIVRRLEAIPHVSRLRIHTRLPIVLPSRIDRNLLGILAKTRLACVLVVHANHPAELDGTVAAALSRLARARVVLLNQTVLLAGVNDAFEPLRRLSERLVELRVVPYYLHLLDRVRGTAHFDVSEETALALHAKLRASLPGYAVPRLVREMPGHPAKMWIA